MKTTSARAIGCFTTETARWSTAESTSKVCPRASGCGISKTEISAAMNFIDGEKKTVRWWNTTSTAEWWPKANSCRATKKGSGTTTWVITWKKALTATGSEPGSGFTSTPTDK